MSTVRVHKDANYFSASNQPFNDQRLSWAARGVMGYLLSKHDGWECRNYDLINQSKEGRHVIKRIMAELKEAGYIHRYRVSNGRGGIEWKTEVFESPELNPHFTKGQLSALENTKADFSTVDSFDVEKPVPLISTDSHASTDSVKKTPSPRINAELPPYSHLDLDNKWVYYQKKEGDQLVRGFITSVTPKKVWLTLEGEDGKPKCVNPEGHVFYQNGHADLQGVVIGQEPEKAGLDPEILALKKQLIDMTGAAEILIKRQRMAAMADCQQAAETMHKKGYTLEDLYGFEYWYPRKSWRGKRGDQLTLTIISQDWAQYRKDLKDGFKVPARFEGSESGLEGQASGIGGDESAGAGGGIEAISGKFARLRANGGFAPSDVSVLR